VAALTEPPDLEAWAAMRMPDHCAIRRYDRPSPRRGEHGRTPRPYERRTERRRKCCRVAAS